MTPERKARIKEVMKQAREAIVKSIIEQNRADAQKKEEAMTPLNAM
jgi:hypothetical protein